MTKAQEQIEYTEALKNERHSMVYAISDMKKELEQLAQRIEQEEKRLILITNELLELTRP